MLENFAACSFESADTFIVYCLILNDRSLTTFLIIPFDLFSNSGLFPPHAVPIFIIIPQNVCTDFFETLLISSLHLNYKENEEPCLTIFDHMSKSMGRTLSDVWTFDKENGKSFKGCLVTIILSLGLAFMMVNPKHVVSRELEWLHMWKQQLIPQQLKWMVPILCITIYGIMDIYLLVKFLFIRR